MLEEPEGDRLKLAMLGRQKNDGGWLSDLPVGYTVRVLVLELFVLCFVLVEDLTEAHLCLVCHTPI